MEIIKTSGEMQAVDIYNLTMSPKVQKMSDVEGQRLEVSRWCVYKDVNSKEEEQTILSLQTPELEIFATNSPTFIEDFQKMHDMFEKYGEIVTSIEVVSGQSKAGRKFITCTYAGGKKI